MFSKFFYFFGCHSLNDNHKKTFERVADRERRNCTNVISLLLFLLFLVGLLYLSFYSAKVGDPLRFFYAVDSYGNQCGMDNIPFNLTFREQKIAFTSSGMKFRHRTHVFPLDVSRPFESLWICVASCPQKSFYRVDELVDYIAKTADSSLCAHNFDLDPNKNVARHDLSNTGPCPLPPVYKSKSVINRCLPENKQELHSASIEQLKKFVDSEDYLRQLFNDFYNGRFVFAAVIIISLVVSLCITYAMIWNNTKIVYVVYITTMPSGIICSLVLACTFLYNFVNSFFLETNYLGLSPNYERFVNGNRVDYAILFWLTVLVTVFTFVSWIVTWTIFKPRRNLVSELFFQARKPLACMLWLVPETLFNCLFSLALFGLWIYVLLNLLSLGEPSWHIINTFERKSDTQLSAITAVCMLFPSWHKFALVYHVIAFLWIKSFLADAQKIFVAEATSSWYFGENRKSAWKFVYFRSLYYLFRFHLGSVAFGSLALLCVRVPSHLFLFIYYRIAKSERPSVVSFYNYFFPLLSKAERILRYIHSNAYAVVGANGEDFLAACKTATNLWMDNSWNMMTTNTVANLLFIMTKCVFAVIIGFLTGLYFRLNSDIEYWLWPTLVSAALAYFIINRFLMLHEMIIETMFLCYACEIDGFDSQRQIAVNGPPKKTDYGFNYYMARRIYEERHLNNSSLGFSLSAIMGPSPASAVNNGQIVNTAALRNANEIEHSDLNGLQNIDNTGGLYGHEMVSTPLLTADQRYYQQLPRRDVMRVSMV